ncbi:scamp family-domain-containing protein [Syncephalis pseudoplumigaleata]|uniref:Scamp family-domain-containing protein n=1 Tax=Syncephalis pseudoplumigaleata TaxID=1712513 RepID=A0A4P9Z4W5_9FUNG|nr:scamp family-domain-containing protein [Syncephalis pseudoplumigaleata]|eukprot:RKP27112.1 scamp family-domain-containing protein [Syncephalis pseudoplumigaleata]
MASQNPFDDEDLVVHEHDPFADPSIAIALQTPTGELPASSPLLMTPKGDTFTSPPARSVQSGVLDSREAELQRREQELAEREQRLRDEAEAIRNAPGVLRAPNFPFFYPLFYLDINVEIPESERHIVRLLFRSWLATIGTLLWNAIACFLILVSHATGVTTGASDFGVALMYCFTITAASFFLWYRPIYNAYMKERSMYYYFYFIFNGFHIGFQYYMTIGIPASGSAGIINSISMMSDGKVVAAIFGIIAAALWGLGGTFSLYLYRKVHYHYRVQGHTFAEAKGDALQTMASGHFGSGYGRANAANNNA